MYSIGAWFIVIIVIAFAAFCAVTVIWGIRAHRQKVSAGREDLIGRRAEVRTPINPKGTVLIEGELWTAISEGERIESGEEVIVTRVEGLKLWVTKSKGGKK